jgi:hypothetical protein
MEGGDKSTAAATKEVVMTEENGLSAEENAERLKT